MGKAAHVGVGRLLSLDNLDGVQGRGCMNNAREMETGDGQIFADGTGKEMAEEPHPRVL